MEEAVRAMLRRHAFRPGRVDPARIAGDFAVPLITYHRDTISLFRTRDEIAAALQSYFAKLEANGVEHVDPRVLEITPGGPERVSALVDWCHVAPDGQVIAINRSRSFFRRAPGRVIPQVELVEYLTVGTRSIFAETPVSVRRVH